MITGKSTTVQFFQPKQVQTLGNNVATFRCGSKKYSIKSKLTSSTIPRLQFICVSQVYWQCLGLPQNSQTSKMLLGKPPHLVTWKEKERTLFSLFSLKLKRSLPWLHLSTICPVRMPQIICWRTNAKLGTTRYFIKVFYCMIYVGNVKISREPERSETCPFSSNINRSLIVGIR